MKFVTVDAVTAKKYCGGFENGLFIYFKAAESKPIKVNQLNRLLLCKEHVPRSNSIQGTCP